MPFTTYSLNNMLNASHGKTAYPLPANLFFALSTTTPNAAGGNVTEPAGGAYARVQVPATSFNVAANGSITNNTAVQFPTATGSWGTVTNVAVFDAATAGNLLFSAVITSQAVASGVTPSIAAGAATSTLT